MKFAKLFSAIILLNTILINVGFSQENEIEKPTSSETALVENEVLEEEIFVRCEVMPRFPGCENLEGTQEEKSQCAQEKMMDYIYSNLIYPNEALKYQQEGQVVIKFIIDKEGNIRQPEVLRDPGHGLGDAAKKLVLSMNQMTEKWSSGTQRGRPVNVWYTLPIKYSLYQPKKNSKKKK
jgi:TonB family protein